MGTWPTVVSLGELLLDLVAVDPTLPLMDVTGFHRAAGGAPANVAVALARLGVRAGFIGKVGDDVFGHWLRQTLLDADVDVRGLLIDPSARTPLAFAGSDGQGGRTFVFYHHGMADTLLRTEDVNTELIAQAKIFHFGSVTLADSPGREATLFAASEARRRGCLVSFDPNVRLGLWDSPDAAREAITAALPLADIVKISADELEYVTGRTEPADACHRLREFGPGLAVVTLGGDGCQFETASAAGRVAGIPIAAIDTLGAGDAFVAGLLSQLANQSSRDVLEDPAALLDALRFANAVGAITTTTYGAIPALPTQGQVERLLNANDRLYSP